MSKYVLDKNFKPEKYVSFEDLDGYVFKPHVKKNQYIKVKTVKVVDRYMLDKILTLKFDRNFKNLINMALKVLNDDDASDEDAEIVLGEVELVREILLNRYEKYLSVEKTKLFLKKLRVIDNEIRMKQIQIKQRIMLMEMEEQMRVGRGR